MQCCPWDTLFNSDGVLTLDERTSNLLCEIAESVLLTDILNKILSQKCELNMF